MSKLADAVAAVQADVAAIKKATPEELEPGILQLEADVSALAKLINSVLVLITDEGLEVVSSGGQPMVIS